MTLIASTSINFITPFKASTHASKGPTPIMILHSSSKRTMSHNITPPLNRNTSRVWVTTQQLGFASLNNCRLSVCTTPHSRAYSFISIVTSLQVCSILFLCFSIRIHGLVFVDRIVTRLIMTRKSGAKVAWFESFDLKQDRCVVSL